MTVGRLFRRTLVRRISVSLVLAFLVIYVLTAVYVIRQQRIKEERGEVLLSIGPAFAQALAAADTPEQAQAMATALDATTNGYRRKVAVPNPMLIQLWDRQQQRWVFASPHSGDTLLPGVPDRQLKQVINGADYRVFQADGPRWSFRLAQPDMQDAWLWPRVGREVLVFIGIIFGLTLVAIWLAVSHGLRPLQRLSNEIGRRSADDLSALGAQPHHQELRPLVSALDTLLERLRHTVQREHAFVHDAAHELRTPMAVISAQAHVLALAADAPQRQEAEQRMDQAVARASHLVEQLLQLARVDRPVGDGRGPVDVAQRARQVLADCAPAAMARGIELSLEAADSLPLTLDWHTTESVLHNLIDNAIRYGRPGGRVAAELRHDGHALRLSVADDGPGIPPHERRLVFERFYRGACHDAAGSGLGLAIVQQAVGRLRGQVQLSEGLDGRGCRFSATIPCTEET